MANQVQVSWLQFSHPERDPLGQVQVSWMEFRAPVVRDPSAQVKVSWAQLRAPVGAGTPMLETGTPADDATFTLTQAAVMSESAAASDATAGAINVGVLYLDGVSETCIAVDTLSSTQSGIRTASINEFAVAIDGVGIGFPDHWERVPPVDTVWIPQ